MQTEKFDRAASAYVEAHFWTLPALAEAVDAPPSRVLELTKAGVAPGAIYARDPARGWWSALGGWADGGGDAPGGEAEAWFSPATVWDLRRARLAERESRSDAEIAQHAAEDFARAFTTALEAFAPAQIAFADCFDGSGRVEAVAAAARAKTEWESWLRGGYAVCLRAFSGETCVRKEALGALLKRHVADPGAWPMPAAEALDACAALAQLILPFAPWERPTGTPGRTLDVLLARHRLGRERPYG